MNILHTHILYLYQYHLIISELIILSCLMQCLHNKTDAYNNHNIEANPTNFFIPHKNQVILY